MFRNSILSGKNNSSYRRKGGSSLLAVLLVLSFVLASGCKKVQNSFPEIPTSPDSETTETTPPETPPIAQTVEITIATSLSYDVCLYLAKLSYAKSQGLLGEGVTGETVDLDYLDSIDLPYILHVYETSENGCNTQTLRQWKNGGNMPDVFLTDCFDQVVSEGLALPISDYLAGNALLSADSIYPDQVLQFNTNGSQYGIPFQASACVLFCDMEVMRQANILTLPFYVSKSSFTDMLASLSALNEEERLVIPFYLASELLPVLPCSLYRHEYLSASVDEDRADPSFRDARSYADLLIRSGYTYESMTDEEIDLFLNGLSPLLSRKVGVWAGTTDAIPVYDNYMPNTLSIMQLPGENEEEETSPILICYPLCVSSSCKNPKEACELASFIALDEDALLLTGRLSPREGYLPCIRSPRVWKSVTATGKYGHYLMEFQNRMDEAIYIPAVSDSTLYQEDLNYIDNEFKSMYPITQEET